MNVSPASDGVLKQSMDGKNQPESPPSSKEEKVVVAEENHHTHQVLAGVYSHFGTHYRMLSDVTRTSAYQRAIANNAASTFRGKTVLDLGCGTGILSLFCAEAGAASVVGVDMSSIVDKAAKEIVARSGHANRIRLLRGRVEDLAKALPKEVDVIVSEWMGYFLLFEGTIDSLIAARDRHLRRPGGVVLPNRYSLYLAGVSDPGRHNEMFKFWEDVYGHDMTCMRETFLTEASVEAVSPEAVVSGGVKILDLDMQTCTRADTEFETDFVLKINSDCELTAIAGYFDSFFDLPEKSEKLPTGPCDAPTHWRQTVFYLDKKVSVRAGQEMRGRVEVSRQKGDPRSLEVWLALEGVMERRRYALTIVDMAKFLAKY